MFASLAAAADQAQQARRLLERFRVTHDVAALNQAIELAAQLPKPQAGEQRALWRAIGSAIDHEMHPEDGDLPQLNLAPPPETGLPAGVAPDSIKDPALRQAYERAIEENKRKVQRAHYQHALQLAQERTRALMSESEQR
ncbi:hypothetical protein [Duganella sp.]|uniref:hypothetical protein n=1 Tax=Duganella sp. TaxID=1904440 RepID=UPI0031E02847